MIPDSIKAILENAVHISGEKVKITDVGQLQSEIMDRLVWKAVFGNSEERAVARWVIWELAQQIGVRPCSIHDFYIARGRGEVASDFTVPAVNLRGMTYDMARALFAQVGEKKVGAFIAELARSEMEYTSQSPVEYSTVILGAALREGFRGPVFIQGDHFQVKAKTSGIPEVSETESLKKLIESSIKAGFLNIDIDMSTLVRFEKSNVFEQQSTNVRYTALFLEFIRSLEPKDISIATGGEIGHIGGRNSTVEEFRAFMDGLREKSQEEKVDLSKVSVQTGTRHGGTVLPDGSIARVGVDFSVLHDISRVARDEYHIGGAVQHGASTLADRYFHHFPEVGTLEIHLATAFQNLVFDHSQFPKDLLGDIYRWIDSEMRDEREKHWSDEQFHYKLRKKAWGKFKKELWNIDNKKRDEIRRSLEARFGFLFRELNVNDTERIVGKFTKRPRIRKWLADFFID